ncbi:hypothetical protein F4553_003261 [Allocatelliglobosispora scoriae]|uniref:2'-5' RNA ligase family protein n=1 Tax=Allocatelliglobosispora scoriae TaxID=643052 RepID=A0A841BT16_9ACTN|nr:hypothetical protein [Allocatelliglobosispora scoriae]MBB5869882.1 hypothetical protein [Allocatelliglobosispora scoriae]
MVDHLAVVEKGRAALLTGDTAVELPPAEGRPRWGVSMLLRPDPAMLDTLASFAAAAGIVAGGGHWAHGPALLHVSLRALQPYRDNPDLDGYAESLHEAASQVPAFRATVRTVSPHPQGIAVHVHPVGGALDDLYRRVGEALSRRGLTDVEDRYRDIWYCNVLHFAAPVDIAALVTWCDERRDLVLGETTLNAVELVRYRFADGAMRAVTLHSEPLLQV